MYCTSVIHFTFEYANDKVCAEHLENILQLQKPLPNLWHTCTFFSMSKHTHNLPISDTVLHNVQVTCSIVFVYHHLSSQCWQQLLDIVLWWLARPLSRCPNLHGLRLPRQLVSLCGVLNSFECYILTKRICKLRIPDFHPDLLVQICSCFWVYHT